MKPQPKYIEVLLRTSALCEGGLWNDKILVQMNAKVIAHKYKFTYEQI